MDWLQCEKHGETLLAQFIERVALILIERECAIRNRDSVAKASRLSNVKKIFQQAKRPRVSHSDSTQASKKLKYHPSMAAELSYPNMIDEEIYKQLNKLYDDNDDE